MVQSDIDPYQVLSDIVFLLPLNLFVGQAGVAVDVLFAGVGSL
jgi:hypothetical protein